MDKIFVRQLAVRAPFAAAYLQDRGLAVSVDGDDLVIPKEVCDKISNTRALNLGPQILLEPTKFAEIAANMAKQVPAAARGYEFTPPDSVRVSEGFGILSEFDRITTMLAISRSGQEVDILRDELLPFISSRLGAKFVTGISVNLAEQQTHLSLTKIALLASRYDASEVKNSLDRRVLDGILPPSLYSLGFIDALTRFPPLFLTLPVDYRGCAWHFQNDAMWQFLNVPTNGISSLLSMSLQPLSGGAHSLGLRGLGGMDEAEVWRYLKFVVYGVNRLLSYANDFRNFTNMEGAVDLVKKCQAYGAIYLIFADIQSLISATSSYHRISFAMSVLDKLANLRCQLGWLDKGGAKSEPIAFKGFFSAAQHEELKTTVSEAMKAMNYDSLAEKFTKVIDRSYSDLREGMASQIAGDDREERYQERLWSQRNLRHGTFLGREQFENTFVSSRGTVPESLATIAFALVVGLISDPKRFLEFRPK